MRGLVDKLRHWLGSLEPRERRLVLVAAAALIVFLPYQFIWSPLQNGIEDLETRVARERRDLAAMQSLALEVQRLRQQGAVAGTLAAGQSLLTVTDASARQQLGVAVENVREEGEGVRVQLRNAPFDDVMRWLDAMQQRYGAVVSEISIDRQDAGRISGRVVLSH